MLNKLRVFVLFLMFMGVLGNISILHADIFKIDEFQIIKNGSTLFDDTFSDGNPPPSAPNYSNGNTASYSVTGTVGPESSGKLALNTSLGELWLNTLENGYNLADRATLLTSSGLNSNATFTVIGIFDLALPSAIGTRYDVRLYEGNATIAGNDMAILGVVRDKDGNVYIQFIHADNITNTSTLIDQILFNPSLGNDQIALRLSKDNAGNDTINASFAYINNGVFGQYYTFSNTIDIFNGESFTLASFGAKEVTTAPEPSSMLLLGLGLIGIAGVRRKFQN